MGDLIEITTWPEHQNIFYKVSSGALLFEVKAPGNASIGLARKPGATCDYWIVLGDNRKVWIKKNNEHSKSVNAPNIITLEEYRSFWITWNGGYIRLGRNGETRPIISYTNNGPILNYVTFNVMRERNPVHWRFELQPVLKRPKLKLLTCGEPRWVPYDGQLPVGAVIGGYETEPLYVVRANHRGSLTPGKFVPCQGTAYISWGGESHDKNEFEVLCGFDFIWVPTTGNRIPVGALEAGHSEDRMERLYVGRGAYHGHVLTGKVQPSHNVCYVSFEDREVPLKKYEILVEPNKNVHSITRNFISDINIDSASDSEDNDDEEPHMQIYNDIMDEFDEYNERFDHDDDYNESD